MSGAAIAVWSVCGVVVLAAVAAEVATQLRYRRPVDPPDPEPVDTSGFGWIDPPQPQAWPRPAGAQPDAAHEAWAVQGQEADR